MEEETQDGAWQMTNERKEQLNEAIEKLKETVNGPSVTYSEVTHIKSPPERVGNQSHNGEEESRAQKRARCGKGRKGNDYPTTRHRAIFKSKG